MADPLLRVRNAEVVYSDVILVLRGVSLDVPRGSIVALLGANGAGKTTLLRAVSGLLDIHRGEVTKGSVELDGTRIDKLDPPAIVRRGVSQVMEGRRIFKELTVDENLRAGGITRRDKAELRDVARAGDGAVPDPGRTAATGRRLPVGRRAADAGHRPRR